MRVREDVRRKIAAESGALAAPRARSRRCHSCGGDADGIMAGFRCPRASRGRPGGCPAGRSGGANNWRLSELSVARHSSAVGRPTFGCYFTSSGALFDGQRCRFVFRCLSSFVCMLCLRFAISLTGISLSRCHLCVSGKRRRAAAEIRKETQSTGRERREIGEREEREREIGRQRSRCQESQRQRQIKGCS